MASQQGGGMVSGKKKPDSLAALMASIGAMTGQTAGELPSGPDYGQDSVDYYQQALSAYAPQFDYLDQAGASARSRAASGDKGLAALYAALSKDILGQAGGIKQNYDSGINQVGQAYNQALASVGQSYDASRNGVADTLARLGIQEAGANTVAKQSQQQALMQSILAANGMANKNMLSAGRSSALRYNTEQATNAKYAGAEQRSGLKRQLASFLDQLAMKRADVQSQANQYGMQMESQAASSAGAAARDDRDFQYKVAHDKALLDLERQKLTGSTKPTAATDPLGKVSQLAMQLYGNQQGASNAVKAVTDASNQLPDGFTYNQLIDEIHNRLIKANGRVGDEGYLRQLAALFYQQMYD